MATRSAISQSAETRSNKNRTGIKRSNPERISCVPNDVRLRAALVFLHDVGGMKAAQKVLAQLCELRRLVLGRAA
jgi:hypothetical protein